MSVDYRVGDALAEWLQADSWDYFFTITCRRERRDSIAFIRDVSQVVQYDRMFIACEPHRYSYNLHAHGLIAVETAVQLPWRGDSWQSTPHELWDKWFHKFGRSRVEPIRSMHDVASYCSKYVTKITDGDNYNYLTTGV